MTTADELRAWFSALQSEGRAPCLFCGRSVHHVPIDGTDQAMYGHVDPCCLPFSTLMNAAMGAPIKGGRS